MRATYILALIAAAAIAAGWWWSVRPVSVSTATLTRGDAAEVVYATGVVEPEHWAEVTALERARIVESCACERDVVEAGAPLFRLDDRAARAHLRELQARLDLAEKSLDRVAPLLEREIVSPDRYDAALAQVSELRAAVAVAESALDDRVLRSPMHGMVLRLDGEVGEVATPGDSLAWVGQPRPLRIVAEVNEEDIPRVQVGQRALLRADAFPEDALEATVAAITPMGDTALRTYRVYLDLPKDTKLLIGMSVDVNILQRVVEDAVLAPAAAVIDGAVFVVEDGALRRAPVTLGVTGAETVEIVDGAEAGAVVVSPAGAGLSDGQRVRAAP
jgi:membrane fusion protein (multidrug efflux system)